jgi:hypothetical protein
MNDGNTDQGQRKWPAELASLDRPPAERAPRAERSQVMWSWIAVIAMVFVLGVTFYAIDTRLDERHARQVPAATGPSLASDPVRSTPARQPSADQTTGQSEPRNETGKDVAR